MTDYDTQVLNSLSEWIHEAISCESLSISKIEETILETLEEQEVYFLTMLNRVRDLKKGFQKMNTELTWKVPIEQDVASGEYFLPLPDDLIATMQWSEGDVLEIGFDENLNLLIQKEKK